MSAANAMSRSPAAVNWCAIVGKAKQLWSPLYRTWFPKGLEDPNLILLKVHVQEAEYWHAPEGRMVQVPGFAKAAIG